jgi:hypothetical protein
MGVSGAFLAQGARRQPSDAQGIVVEIPRTTRSRRYHDLRDSGSEAGTTMQHERNWSG